jgi:hypothetical protein
VQPQQQTSNVDAGEQHSGDSAFCEDRQQWNQDDDGPLNEPEYPNADGTDGLHELHSEVELQDHIDPAVEYSTDNDHESSLAGIDCDHALQDAHHVDSEDQPDPGFDDICQLPPVQQEAEFWDQTVDDPADQDLDRRN